MSLQKAGTQAIEGLVRIEETLFEIYGLFAERFPAHREMWSRLAGEEQSHAEWIRDLFGKVEQGSLNLREDSFRMEGIQTFLDYANERLEEAKSAKLPFLHALDMALDLESGLLEREFFRIFEADSEALEQAFEDMQRQIRDHTERIRKALTREGSRS
jgi:rubrerythrin